MTGLLIDQVTLGGQRRRPRRWVGDHGAGGGSPSRPCRIAAANRAVRDEAGA